MARMPDVLVDEVLKRLSDFYRKHEQELPELARQLTVREVVKRIFGLAGFTTWTSSHSGGASEILKQHWGVAEAAAGMVAEHVDAANPMRKMTFARPARAEGFEAALREIKENQEKMARRNSERHKDVLKGQQEIKRTLKDMQGSLRAMSSMLGALLQGEHDCPRWMVMVPKPPSESKLEAAISVFKLSTWINKTAVLYFVCPVTMQVMRE